MKLAQLCVCMCMLCCVVCTMHGCVIMYIYQLTMSLMSSSMVAMITQNTYHSSDVTSAEVSTTLDHVHAHARCAEKEGVAVSGIIIHYSIPTTANYFIMRGAGRVGEEPTLYQPLPDLGAAPVSVPTELT